MEDESNSDDEPTRPGVDPPSADEALLLDSAVSFGHGAQHLRETAGLIAQLGGFQRETALRHLVSILDGISIGVLAVKDEIERRIERKDPP